MPYISKHFIDQLLDDSKLEDVIKDFVELKKEGANYKGLSPFGDERTPSFVVSPVKQIWKDYSTGKGGNNAISFLMAKGHSYPEAIKYLANKQGKSIEYDDSKQAKAYQEKQLKIQGLRPTLEYVIKNYTSQFNNLKSDHPAKQEVFTKRQYSQDIADTYQIGFAPGNKFIYNKLKEKALVNTGKEIFILSGENDFYYNRVTYTIFDANGSPVGIAGRCLKPEPKVKWLNSRDSELYNKQYIWYGLHIAKQEIRKTEIAYITEGYNDVITMQTHGILNTVSPCGTSIHDNQIKALKKYATIAVFFMDPDAAGQKAVLKNIPRFIEAGFRCYTIISKNGDPDDFVRAKWPEIETYYQTQLQNLGDTKEELKQKQKLNTYISSKNIKEWFLNTVDKTEGFQLLINQLKNKDEVQKSVIAKALCEIISKITDDSIVSIYKKWLQKESGVTAADIKKWIGEFKDQREQQAHEKYIEYNEYNLPNNVELTEAIANDIKRYQMFMVNNQIYTQSNFEPPYKFRSVSNFAVFIIQHMRDEEYPKKLVSAENVFKQSFVFDVPSDTFNVSAAFQKAMTNFGNFRWFGRSEDLVRLQALLFDKMGNGRSLDVLGWQHEGFYLFNNLVVVPNDDNIELDKNGCFKYKGVSYYVPSANVIYKDNPYKYMPQKQFRHIPGNVTSYEYFAKVFRVHGNHAISSIFHAIACMFHDIVVKSLKGFPINFSYGPPGTGKDELNHAVKSLWGIPQVATNLEGKNATKTATIRELAQFTNALLEWSEYGRGDSELDGTIKSVWDLRGKKIGNKESKVATDNVPVLSGIALTGNEYPDNAAIITRVIWNDMNRKDFTAEDEKEFNELNDIIDSGITHITVQILKQRENVKTHFNKEYRFLMDHYQSKMPNCNKRMLKNISTLTAFYRILKDTIAFPFNENQIVEHFITITEAQMRKLTSSSINTRWWDCFIASMRGTLSDQILVGKDLKLEGKILFFQYTNCYNKVQRQWFTQYRDAAPAKSTMKEALEKDQSYAGFRKNVNFSYGKNRVRSSALKININELPEDLRELIKAEIKYQQFERNLPETPQTPKNTSDNKENDINNQEELPLE